MIYHVYIVFQKQLITCQCYVPRSSTMSSFEVLVQDCGHVHSSQYQTCIPVTFDTREYHNKYKRGGNRTCGAGKDNV
jgi:hypothetical protein